MAQGFGEHAPPALAAMITSARGGFAELDDGDDCCDCPDEEHDAHDRDSQRHNDRDDFHLRLLLEGDALFSLMGRYLGKRTPMSGGGDRQEIRATCGYTR